MNIIKGKYNTAKVFTDAIEDVARIQIKELCDQEFAKDSKIRIMPDVHAGAGCTIGTTMTIQDAVVPNLVGVDIGCGMETAKLKNKEIDLEQLDRVIYAKIPSGFNIRKIAHEDNSKIDLESLHCKNHVNLHRARMSLGTLGGGNHFIEMGKDENNEYYLVIHSGSRHIGLEVAKYYQDEAYKKLDGATKENVQKLIKEYKNLEREKELEKSIRALNKTTRIKTPKALAYASGELMKNYLQDMKLIQKFAELNRKTMLDEIVKAMNLQVESTFTTTHNYIDTDEMILRKGAVSAKKNEQLLIPINMRDGSLICIGKGNDDWNQSAPHGAGRLMSRTQAKKIFKMETFKAEMSGIYTTSVNEETLDECPMAYKGMDDIIKNICDTVDILGVIKPVYNFKAED